MSEIVSKQDIENWRYFYSTRPTEQLLGSDLFILKCMHSIDALQQRITELEGKLQRANEVGLQLLVVSETMKGDIPDKSTKNFLAEVKRLAGLLLPNRARIQQDGGG